MGGWGESYERPRGNGQKEIPPRARDRSHSCPTRCARDRQTRAREGLGSWAGRPGRGLGLVGGAAHRLAAAINRSCLLCRKNSPKLFAPPASGVAQLPRWSPSPCRWFSRLGAARVRGDAADPGCKSPAERVRTDAFTRCVPQARSSRARSRTRTCCAERCPGRPSRRAAPRAAA